MGTVRRQEGRGRTEIIGPSCFYLLLKSVVFTVGRGYKGEETLGDLPKNFSLPRGIPHSRLRPTVVRLYKSMNCVPVYTVDVFVVVLHFRRMKLP